jgi:predicted phosphate transport protein (TIGR00153 family)
MFGLLPRNLEFFDCFNKGAQNALRAAELLVEFTNATGERRLELVGAIKEKEHVGDQITHETLDRLQKTYLTPIDGDDIHTLTKEIDDIVDEIDDAAQRMMIYKIGDVLPGCKAQCQVLLKAVSASAETIAGLRSMKKGRINGHVTSIEQAIIAVHDAENEGDEIYHRHLGELFESGLGPFDVIKWKEIYEIIEGAIDCCEDVANSVHGIVLKNA